MRKIRVFSGSRANVATNPTFTPTVPEAYEAARSLPVQGKVLWIRVRTTEPTPAATWTLNFRLTEKYRGSGVDIRPLWDPGDVSMTLGDWRIVSPESPVGYEVANLSDLELLLSTNQNAYDLDIDICIEETG